MAVEYKDYYQTLGVGRDADQKEIRKAFRKLARQYHPDVNPGDESAEERFKEVNEAYEVLFDPEKRRKYDQLGADWERYQRTGGRPGEYDWAQWTGGSPGPGDQRVHVRYGTPEDFEDMFGGRSPFSDFFAQVFGGEGQAAPEGFQYQVRPQRGQDYEQEVTISLREAYRGTSLVLQRDGRRLQVQIPAGARTGTRVRMAGEGAPGVAGGEAGDLYLRVIVLDDRRSDDRRPNGLQFERRGDDLYVTVGLEYYTLVLGGKAEVQTMDRRVMLNIPPGTQNGRVFRPRGQGMPLLGQPDQYGDLYVRLEARLPTDLSPRQRELFEALRELG